MAIFLDFPNIIRKMSGDLVVSHSRYQNYLASLMGRVQDIQQFKQVIQVKRWPNLDSDRITDSSQILYMSPIDLLGSVSKPNQVCTQVKPTTLPGDSACLCRIVKKIKSFMGGIKIKLQRANKRLWGDGIQGR